MLLEASHFASMCKCEKQYGLSFTNDDPIIWNDMNHDVHSAKSLFIQKEVENLLFTKAYPP